MPRAEGVLYWDKHLKWYETRSYSRIDRVIWWYGRPVGVVHRSTYGEVGIIIGEKALWGMGIATKALRFFCEDFCRYGGFAIIPPENKRARKAFENAGFVLSPYVEPFKGVILLVYLYKDFLWSET